MPIPLTLPCPQHRTKEMTLSSEPTTTAAEASHGTPAAATEAAIGVAETPVEVEIGVAVETGVAEMEAETGVAEAIGKHSVWL